MFIFLKLGAYFACHNDMQAVFELLPTIEHRWYATKQETVPFFLPFPLWNART